jgi:tRNA threonylcarbamoyladenosine biosynthesis protein TsaB
MNLLAIDTSTEFATVAVAAHGEIYSEEQGSQRQHAQLLLPMVERLLASAGLSFSQLDGIVFGRGPGSFTGLRIACSVAKGLAYAHDLPLYPVSGLATIAYDVYHREMEQLADANVLAMIDARMHQVYWGRFTGESFSVLEQVSSVADITLTLERPLILAGVGCELYISQLPVDIRARIVKECTIFPKAASMIRLVQSGLILAVSASEALPVYVRNEVTHGTTTIPKAS